MNKKQVMIRLQWMRSYAMQHGHDDRAILFDTEILYQMDRPMRLHRTRVRAMRAAKFA